MHFRVFNATVSFVCVRLWTRSTAPVRLSRYAIDYSFANAPLARDLESDNVGSTALFLCSPMAAAVTGVTM